MKIQQYGESKLVFYHPITTGSTVTITFNYVENGIVKTVTPTIDQITPTNFISSITGVTDSNLENLTGGTIYFASSSYYDYNLKIDNISVEQSQVFVQRPPENVVIQEANNSIIITEFGAGSSGSSGMTGTNGISGSSGASGTSGLSGTNGVSGTSGQTGSSGSSGATGNSGSSGSSASSGLTGSSGSSGMSVELNYVGLWTASSYVANTVAISTIDGNTYVSKVVTTNVYTDPANDPTEWELFTYAGENGTSGVTGSSGSSGASGISAGQVYYFNQSQSSNVSPYKVLSTIPSTASQQSVTKTGNNSTPVLVQEFLTPQLGFATIPGGTQRFHLHYLKTNQNHTIDTYVTIQLADASGTGIGPILSSGNGTIGWIDSITPVEVTTDLTLSTTTVDPTNRMIVKIYIVNASSHSVQWITEGTGYYSFVLTTVGAIAGSSGSSGQTGATGTSGINGTSGQTGSSGSSGVSGGSPGLVNGTGANSLKSAASLTPAGAAAAAGESAIALGANASAPINGGIAIGRNAIVDSSGSDGAIAIGKSTNAVKNRAVAIGYDNDSEGEGTIVIGDSSRAVADRSISIGSGIQQTNPTFNDTISLGTDTQSDGVRSIAIGQNATTTDDNGIAVGFNAVTNGLRGIAIGSGASASAQDAINIGKGGVSSGLSAIKIGKEATATQMMAITIGFESNATAEGAIALGGQVTASTPYYTTTRNLQLLNYANLNFASDAAAATGGVPLGGFYHTNGALKIRIA